jgi:uncharacterized protein YceK
MKKSMVFVGLMMFFTIILLSGCKKEETKTENCNELHTNYASATTAFITAPSEATCNAYKEALVAYLNGCAILSPADKKELQDTLDDEDCKGFD